MNLSTHSPNSVIINSELNLISSIPSSIPPPCIFKNIYFLRLVIKLVCDSFLDLIVFAGLDSFEYLGYSVEWPLLGIHLTFFS